MRVLDCLKLPWLLLFCLCLPSAAMAEKKWHMSAPNAGIQLQVLKPFSNRPLTVTFSGFPGNKQDWISIMPVGAADNTYRDGLWSYTHGQRSGQVSLGKLPAGQYELRAYLNWPAGGYQVVKRQPFTVFKGAASVTGTGPLRLTVMEPRAGQPLLVKFSGFPGNAKDWISVVKQGASDRSYQDGYWAYTDGRKQGSMTLGALSAGNYEVRAYFNWPKGGYEVKLRQPLHLGGSITLFDNWNNAECAVTDSVYFYLPQKVKVTQLVSQLKWPAGVTSMPYQISLGSQVIQQGKVDKGPCEDGDWCEGRDSTYMILTKAHYKLQFSGTPICSNAGSGNQGYLRLLGERL